ncbi:MULTISPECIES: hypothetical protein [unclassified Bradyrhizobium]|uniref:hypothetical protein n=1 Tax=unclassified Bradyrhizobium TaxID=2631580 RepID=UPI0020B25BF0|nr:MULTISPECIES: hypothetical protein [unclassified Bradyrhizobium]MCP3401967.1 hypothetical protein [Bradyrhizobium sp. CCGB20]MCP3410452.1 hypothetical protein [Bradyrhizobium sp. CCGB01]
MVIDEKLARLRARHNNIRRYRRLLSTELRLWNGSIFNGGSPRRRWRLIPFRRQPFPER